MTSSAEKEIINSLLSLEHREIAFLLNLTNSKPPGIDYELLYKAIGVIDRLSRNSDDKSRKKVITLIAILWTYQKTEWKYLKDFFILVLSRIGFSPSSVMIDNDYDLKNGRYSTMQSIIDELFVAIHQLQDEVTVQQKKFLLTRFQKNIWDKIDSNKLLGISAPTSAGKSFIIALKAIDLLLKKDGCIIYIVPTLSLVTQVGIDFRRLLDKFNLQGYEILNTYTGTYADNKKIFILTQEKAIGAFSQSGSPFKNVRMLIVDEVQNIERVADENDQRSKTLYDLLVEFRHSTPPDRIIISGPRIEKIGNLGLIVFGEKTEEEDSKSSPVASLTYSIAKKNKQYYFKQYSDILEKPRILAIENASQIAGVGLALYNEVFHKFLSNFVNSLGVESINIIFSPNAGQARKTALAIAGSKIKIDTEKIESLIDYLSYTVHPKYDLCNALSHGVAYHHGQMPHHVRRVLEKAISEKIVKNVVCTTTLMQGVNLPAQNVIIRNPNLYIKKKTGQPPPKLTNYEIANLRGRAGRLLKDFLGRTFALDENAFEAYENPQEELFEEATKEICPGYGEFYAENQVAIEQDLLSNKKPSEENKEYSFLITYIRQTILKHGEDAERRFQSVNIEIEKAKFNKIREQMAALKVPSDICIKNRYWDPLDLDMMFSIQKEFRLASSATGGIASKLYKCILKLRSVFPFYYERYVRLNLKLLFSVCVNSEQWIKEWPLKDILNTEYHNEPHKIEGTISMLQNKVSFGLPMFLKPIYDMKLPENAFLRFLELGAHKPVTRRLIEYSIPRETAIFLANEFVGEINIDSTDFDKVLIEKLKSNYDKFDYWTQVQLETVL